jgi:hypothetical protein
MKRKERENLRIHPGYFAGGEVMPGSARPANRGNRFTSFLFKHLAQHHRMSLAVIAQPFLPWRKAGNAIIWDGVADIGDDLFHGCSESESYDAAEELQRHLAVTTSFSGIAHGGQTEHSASGS